MNTNSNKEKEMTIIVNATPEVWSNKEISFEEVVGLAFPNVNNNGNMEYSVVYSRAHGNHEGSLVAGESVKVKNEMEFDVTATNRS
jgi:hypothetical protein